MGGHFQSPQLPADETDRWVATVNSRQRPLGPLGRAGPAPGGQHHQVLQLISAAAARGQTQLVEMNRQVLGNLEKIITVLQVDATRSQVAADAI